MLKSFSLFWLLVFVSVQIDAQETNLLDSSQWEILAPDLISLPDIRETSPSLTASNRQASRVFRVDRQGKG